MRLKYIICTIIVCYVQFNSKLVNQLIMNIKL